ncbi:MAG: hypothetical protein LBJ37_11445 [Paucimonas sp.]|nr:hypothetical protein [Paucimonas sp.]
MDVKRLDTVDSVETLLTTDERGKPGLMLVGCSSAPQPSALLSHVQHLAAMLPQFVFYELDLDDYRAPSDAKALKRLLQDWQIDAPAQVLLPSNHLPTTLHVTRCQEIDRALKRLY